MKYIKFLFLFIVSSNIYGSNCFEKKECILFVGSETADERIFKLQSEWVEMSTKVYSSIEGYSLEHTGFDFYHNKPVINIPVLGEALSNMKDYIQSNFLLALSGTFLSPEIFLGEVLYGGISEENLNKVKSQISSSVYNEFLMLLKDILIMSDLSDSIELSDKVKAYLDQNIRVVTLAYSTGTILDNTSYNILKSSSIEEKISRYGTVHLANVAALEQISNPVNLHLTTNKDLVALVSSSVDANFNIVTDNDSRLDPLNHYLLETYLSMDVFANSSTSSEFLGKNMANNSALSLFKVLKETRKINDCNNDGVLEDIAFETDEGGYISEDSTLENNVIIADNARVCAKSIILANSGVISGEYIISNTEIGRSCDFIEISSPSSDKKIENSFICTGSEPIQGSSFQSIDTNISYSTINPQLGNTGNTISLTNSTVRFSTFSNAHVNATNSSFSDGFKYSGRSFIYDGTFIGGSYHAVSSKVTLSNGDELIGAVDNSILNNATITGFPIVQGTITDSSFSGNTFTEAADSGILLVNHLNGGEIINNSTVGGNAEIAGVVSGSTVNGVSTPSVRSFLLAGSSILDSSASGYFAIFSGTVTEPLANQCYFSGSTNTYNSEGECVNE